MPSALRRRFVGSGALDLSFRRSRFRGNGQRYCRLRANICRRTKRRNVANKTASEPKVKYNGSGSAESWQIIRTSQKTTCDDIYRSLDLILSMIQRNQFFKKWNAVKALVSIFVISLAHRGGAMVVDVLEEKRKVGIQSSPMRDRELKNS